MMEWSLRRHPRRDPMRIASVAIDRRNRGESAEAANLCLAEQTQNARERSDTGHYVDSIHSAGSGSVTNRFERSELTRIERDADTLGTHVNHYTSRLDEAERLGVAPRARERSCRGFARNGGPAELFESSHRWQKGSQCFTGNPVKAT